MKRPHHGEGIVLAGCYTVNPPLGAEERDLLDVLADLSLRVAVRDTSSSVLDALAPGHPAGPSAWVACEDGCCLELRDHGYTRIDAIEPWLRYLVGTTFRDRRIDGHTVWWDTEERTFTALGVRHRQVRREPLFGSGRAAARSKTASIGSV